MSWAEVFKINSNMKMPLDKLINERLSKIEKMVGALSGAIYVETTAEQDTFDVTVTDLVDYKGYSAYHQASNTYVELVSLPCYATGTVRVVMKYKCTDVNQNITPMVNGTAGTTAASGSSREFDKIINVVAGEPMSIGVKSNYGGTHNVTIESFVIQYNLKNMLDGGAFIKSA